MLGLRLVVFATRQLVPLVVRNAVAIPVERDHDDARLGASARIRVVGIRRFGSIKRIAQYLEVVFARHVHHAVVEAESDVTAESPQRDHPVVRARNGFFRLFEHVGIGVSRLVFGHHVHELPRRRTIFVHLGDIAAVSHFFLPHDDMHVVHVRIRLVFYSQAKVVFARHRLAKDEVAAGGNDGFIARAVGHRPEVAIPVEPGMQHQGLHARHRVPVVYAETDHRYFFLARTKSRGQT